MYKKIYYGTASTELSILAEKGLNPANLVSSKQQAICQARKKVDEKGGQPVILKLDKSLKNDCGEQIPPQKLFILN